MRLINGDSMEVLRELITDGVRVDAVVTDPPYGIDFMQKGWDNQVPGVDLWALCFEILKPGGHLLAFAGTRTQHRMASNIEAAGFEIRDMLAWIYGSGFPKNHDVSKAIDKAAGVEFSSSPASGVGFMNPEGKGGYNVTINHLKRKGQSTPEAQQWKGWGTALKPALEPITLARKPFKGSVARNVLEYGTGAINVGGCRIEGDRWPANLLHDGSEEATAIFPDDNARFFYCPKASREEREEGLAEFRKVHGSEITGRKVGSAGAKCSRYAGTTETPRRNIHPTVKPITLMRYLCRLITPPGGVVLDPFMGSGTTGAAAAHEGLDFIGVEISPEYHEIAEARIEYRRARAERNRQGRPEPTEIDGLPQLTLF